MEDLQACAVRAYPVIQDKLLRGLQLMNASTGTTLSIVLEYFGLAIASCQGVITPDCHLDLHESSGHIGGRSTSVAGFSHHAVAIVMVGISHVC